MAAICNQGVNNYNYIITFHRYWQLQKWREIPLQGSLLQISMSSASPAHSPTDPSQTRIRLLKPPLQLSEHSDQAPHCVHTIREYMVINIIHSTT